MNNSQETTPIMEHSGNCVTNCPKSPIDMSRCYDILITSKYSIFWRHKNLWFLLCSRTI